MLVLTACTMGWDEFASTSTSSTEPAPDTGKPDDGAHPNGSPDADVPSNEGGTSTSTDGGADVNQPIANCDEPDLIGRWKFDGDAKDCTSHGLGGGIVGSPTYVNGHSGKAISLDGFTHISLGNSLPTRIIGAFTVAAWVNPAVLPSSTSMYVIGKTSSLTTAGWRLGIDPTNVTQIIVARGDSQEPFLTGCNCAQANKWFHFAGVFQPSGYVRLYINGQLTAESTVAPPSVVIDSTAELRIGARGDSFADTYFKGLIDDMRLYGRAMTDGEMANIASQ